MSWLFGLVGQAVRDQAMARCCAIHADPLHVFKKTGAYYIAAGGFARTCLRATRGDKSNDESFAIALGALYAKNGSARTLLTQDAWAHIAFDQPAVNRLEGHFVRLRYADGSCEIATDRLGLRTLYWAETPSGTVVSTRLDWIARFLEVSRIRFETFASRWILYNPLTYDAPLEGVHRLGPSGVLEISPSGTHHRFQYYTPVVRANCSVDDFTEKLRRSLTSSLPGGMRMSLGLSGGLDSRVLLAVLLREKEPGSIDVHTMGSVMDPDVSVSRRIAGTEGLSQRVYDHRPSSTSEALACCRTYLSQTNLIEAGSVGLRLGNYTQLDSERFALSDGGFGEIARRQYLNRLAFKGRAVIERRDADAIGQSLSYRRGNFFTEDVESRMRSGATQEIQRTLEAMPPIDTIAMGDYLDLWAARTRVPNFSCDEQARLDTFIVSDMPFAEGAVFDDIFSLPLKLRKNGALLRTIISRQCPRLEKYPLVKHTTTHPYGLSTLPSRLWTEAKKRLGYGYHDHAVDDFLDVMKECVLDSLHSRETVEYAPYRYGALTQIVHRYYAGERALAGQVNWWFSFDLWRRMVEHG